MDGGDFHFSYSHETKDALSRARTPAPVSTGALGRRRSSWPAREGSMATRARPVVATHTILVQDLSVVVPRSTHASTFSLNSSSLAQVLCTSHSLAHSVHLRECAKLWLIMRPEPWQEEFKKQCVRVVANVRMMWW